MCKINQIRNGDMINMENTFEATHILNFDTESGIEVMIHPMGQTLFYRFFNKGAVDEPVEAEVQYTDGDEYNSEPHNFFYTQANNVYFDLDDFMEADGRIYVYVTEKRSPRNSNIRRIGTR